MSALMAIHHPRYTVHETLGEGAQGRVVRVVDRERPDLRLAAKVVRGGADGRHAEGDASLAGEFALLARLRIAGLVRVHDFGRDTRGALFLVEDLVDGDDAIAALASGNDVERAQRISALALDVAETLAALHDAGFVHGDVKPSNIRVPRPDGSRAGKSRAMLLDLGACATPHSRANAARPDSRALAVHTPAFAAPEVKAGMRPSAQADLYGLGATLWACATGSASRAGELRDRAPWVQPRLADVIASLIAPAPADRPRTARDVLGALGRSAMSGAAWESGAREHHVREQEVRRLLALDAGALRRRVVYLVGPSGAGKSHVAREVVTRALLSGREARLVRFPETDAAFVSHLVRRLRTGADLAGGGDALLLLVLDDLHAASVEVVEALESFRCMVSASPRPVLVVATTLQAPPNAESLAIGPLDTETIERLCRDQGALCADVAREVAREAGGLPGWLFASLGRVPLTVEAALARVAALPEAARSLLALVATLDGHAPESALSATENGLAACFEAGLLEREPGGIRLASPHLAAALAGALGSYEISDRATEIALADTSLPASMLAAVARASCPPERLRELLAETADRARHEEARAIEIEMLLALLADAKARSPARLVRLERLTRDAGIARAHPRVLGWLADAAATDAALGPLAERRRAEERARAGDMSAARDAADRAIALAKALLQERGPEEVYALATRGSIELWSASVLRAAELFAEARALAASIAPTISEESEFLDREEIARLEHNVGVVELYRGRAEAAAAAFEQAIALKRALGDRAGVRACLLNLGLALTRLGRWDDGDAALVEATALADSLGQLAGRGWCLAARADLEVRRGRAREAERHLAEAESIGDAVPKTIRADLVLIRAQIALLHGDGRAALRALLAVDADLRREDALVDARALALEARSKLCLLPAERRGAARAAIASIRRARAGNLAEAENEAVEVLHAVRARTIASRRLPKPRAVHEGERTLMADSKPAQDRGAVASDPSTWDLLRAFSVEPAEVCIARLAALVVSEARAERAFVAEVDEGGGVVRAWGIDLDGLALAEPARRIDADAVRTAKSREGVLYQPAVATAGGTGSRLSVARGRAALVVDHRFQASAFDHVSEHACVRWLTLAEIALRFGVLGGPTAIARDAIAPMSEPSDVDPLGASTFVPRREQARDYPDILGRSSALRRALAQLDAAVDADLPVLVEGETGTGKELFARALHDHGRRRAGPFVAVNCAAIADALFEAELFGHARGAFTGADRARGGLLARAEGGTLLLDELGELPLPRQATLLRVLEERRYRPVGRDDDRPFDVRVVAATNRDLDRCVEEGTFRKDLLYRLRVLHVVVPPLRERRGDVEHLLRHFLARAGSRVPITPAALELLEAYAFPGNVRELEHLAQRLAAASVPRVDVANLPRGVRAARTARESASSSPSERDEVEGALARTRGNISHAAALLGLTRHGLKKRMLRLGLRGKAESS